MEREMERAIFLRKEGKQKESNQILVKLVKEYSNDPVVNYQCAWSFDVLGEESQAVPYYERAIKLGLSGSDLEGAFLGLGSTYRTLGEYEKSEEVLRKGMELFPENQVLRIFYAMTLYNINKHSEAMKILLQSIADTTSDEEILRYKRAIRFYSDKLDETWK
ncbi:tetratricopeptide repeat protein [Bacillus spongiae]|uniref:Tetratricopeptide repeat protein n=1 Tax=Bacillus spongiae TaxID=2683610 RepID=A0ABU8H9G2_9BACI